MDPGNCFLFHGVLVSRVGFHADPWDASLKLGPRLSGTVFWFQWSKVCPVTGCLEFVPGCQGLFSGCLENLVSGSLKFSSLLHHELLQSVVHVAGEGE